MTETARAFEMKDINGRSVLVEEHEFLRAAMQDAEFSVNRLGSFPVTFTVFGMDVEVLRLVRKRLLEIGWDPSLPINVTRDLLGTQLKAEHYEIEDFYPRAGA